MSTKQPFKKTIYVVSARIPVRESGKYVERWEDDEGFFTTKKEAHADRKLYQPTRKRDKHLRSPVKIAKYQLVSVEDYPE